MLTTNVYTTEASESAKKSKAEVDVPDLSPEDAEKVLASHTLPAKTGRDQEEERSQGK